METNLPDKVHFTFLQWTQNVEFQFCIGKKSSDKTIYVKKLGKSKMCFQTDHAKYEQKWTRAPSIEQWHFKYVFFTWTYMY